MPTTKNSVKFENFTRDDHEIYICVNDKSGCAPRIGSINIGVWGNLNIVIDDDGAEFYLYDRSKPTEDLIYRVHDFFMSDRIFFEKICEHKFHDQDSLNSVLTAINFMAEEV